MNETMPLNVHPDCRAIHEVMSQIGDKWSLMVMRALRDQPRRFNDIKRQVGGISQQILTRTLKALERDGMIARTVHPSSPPRVDYALTQLGASLSEPVLQLGQWARTHLTTIHGNRRRYDAAKT